MLDDPVVDHRVSEPTATDVVEHRRIVWRHRVQHERRLLTTDEFAVAHGKADGVVSVEHDGASRAYSFGYDGLDVGEVADVVDAVLPDVVSGHVGDHGD